MIDKHTNVSFYEKILGHFEYWKDFLDMIKSVKNTFENPNLVLWNAFNNKFPLKTELQDGKNIGIGSFNALYLVSKA